MNREQLANSAINKIRRNRFDWADWNCAIASARVAKTYCGIDYSERYFSECKGMLSALRIVKNAGGLDNLISSSGLKEITAEDSQIGDFALGEINLKNKSIPHRQSLGIACGDGTAIFPSMFGYFYLDLINCVKIWEVKNYE